MKKYYIILIAFLGCLGLQAKDMTGLKIYINPGHGGYDSDDRNVAVYPYAQGDTLGFWESSSNLHKGLMLRELLQEQGATVAMSRVLNRTEDDRGLETIGREASEWEADLFFSIHSNATGTSRRDNFPMMLFRGYTENPVKPEDKVAAKILFKHLIENQVTYWTQTEEYVVGDFDFYPDWNNAGLGVLRKLTVTGFLSEGSYHDYVPETYRLLNMDYKWMEAWHFTKAVMEYFDTEGFTTGNIAGVIYDSRMTRTESYVQHGRDKQVPLCGATVTLLPNNITYTTDNGQYNKLCQCGYGQSEKYSTRSHLLQPCHGKRNRQYQLYDSHCLEFQLGYGHGICTKGFLDRPAGRREHYIRRFTVPNGIYPHSSLRGSYPIYRKTR